MHVHFGVGSLLAEWPSAVGCIGTFDGVHLGHRAVISESVRVATDAELPSILITFDRHPSTVLAPDKAPAPIGTLQSNLERFRELGVSVAVVLSFDDRLAAKSASDFLGEIVQDRLHIEKLVVGHDFAFGRGREGTPEWLASRIATKVVPPFELGGSRVSSSAIRSAIGVGDIERATALLGRPYRFEGIVVSGEKLGRQLGFPTINLARSSDQSVPADGVYAAIAHSDLGSYKAAVGIGNRPAVKGKVRTVEAFLIDYPGKSLYGRSVTIEFIARLREERDFPSLEELKVQMLIDVKAAERVTTLPAS